MFHAALLAMMNTTFAPWRFALSISIALMPKAPSPRHHDDLPLRIEQRGGDPDTACRRPGSRTCPSRDRCPALRSPRRAKLRMSPPSAMVIASGFSTFAQRGEDAVRMHVAVVAGGRACERRRRTSTSGAHARSRSAFVQSASRRVRRLHARRASADERERRDARTARLRRGDSRAAPPQLSAMRIQRALRQDRGRAVAHLVVELAPDDDDEVRLLHRPGAHRADERRMCRRARGRGFPACRDRARRVRIEEARRARRAAPIAPRPVITSGRFAAAIIAPHARRRRDRAECAAAASARGTRRARRSAARVSRSTSVGISTYTGPGGLPSPMRGRPCLVEVAQQVVRDAQRARTARHRPHDVDVLRCPAAGRGRPAARGAQPPISSTGTRSSCALAIAVTQLVTPGPAVANATPTCPVSTAWQCAMCTAGAFVAHVDDAHAALRKLIPDRLDVPALQPEHAIDAAGDQELDDPFGDGAGCGSTHRGSSGGDTSAARWPRGEAATHRGRAESASYSTRGKTGWPAPAAP